MGAGQPTFATALDGGTPRDGNTVWEAWYSFQLTDNIAITPALFWLGRPLGADTQVGESFRQFGGVMKTSFRF